jgi:hypothetical protein
VTPFDNEFNGEYQDDTPIDDQNGYDGMVFTGNDRNRNGQFRVGYVANVDSQDSCDAASGAKDESDVRKTIKTMNKNND